MGEGASGSGWRGVIASGIGGGVGRVVSLVGSSGSGSSSESESGGSLRLRIGPCGSCANMVGLTGKH